MAIRLKDYISGNLSGNATTATTLQTTRTINGTNFNGSANITTANWGTARTITIGSTGKSVNGSANVSWSLSEIGAAASSHTHSYLPLSGGTVTGETVFNNYLSVNAWPNYGTGKAQIWFDGNKKALSLMSSTTDIMIGSNYVYHQGRKPTPADIGAAAASHTHNYAGSTSAGGAANSANRLNLYAARASTTNANFAVVGDGSLKSYKATSSMTSNKPSGDGHILHFEWDNTGGYSSQLFLQNTSNPKIQMRGMSAGEWGTWHTVYSTNNKPTPADIGAAASSHTHNYAGSSSAGGAANSANTLATARTINGTSFNGSANITTANWGTARTITIGTTGKSVNGSGNVSWSLSEIGAAAASHTHSYLALSGGSLTGPVNNNYNTATYLAGNQGKTLINSTCSAGSYVMLYKYPSTNGYFTTGGYQGNYLLQYTAKTTVDAGTNSVTKSVTLLNESGNSSFPGTVSAPTFSGALSGNASTATTLQTARTINGTSFNGSANITTANWGTARTITIGKTGKSVNGSANVSWSLAEIGGSTGITADTLALRDSAGDITARLMKSTYANQTTISGAIAYRVNNGTDNYIRFCSDPAAVRTWLGAAASSHTHSYLPLSGGSLTGSVSTSGKLTATQGIDIASRIMQTNPQEAVYLYTNGKSEGVGFDYQGYVRCQNDATWSCGHPSWRWSVVYSRSGVSAGSDGRWKKHIKYIVSDDKLNELSKERNSNNDYMMSTFAYEGDEQNKLTPVLSAKSSDAVKEFTKDLYANDVCLDITTNDLYNFFKDDFQLSSYRYDVEMFKDNNKRNNELNNVGFIAQDIVDTKVGKLFIVEPEEDEEYPNENMGYSYNIQNYASIIAGALKASISEVEKLKSSVSEVEQLKMEIKSLKEQLSVLKNQ